MSTTDLWAELPSPVKTDFRDAFRRYALRVYTGSHILLRDYIPAVMGAHMPREDYLLFMPEEKLPACYVATAFSECSSPAFVNRLLNSGIYASCLFSGGACDGSEAAWQSSGS